MSELLTPREIAKAWIPLNQIKEPKDMVFIEGEAIAKAQLAKVRDRPDEDIVFEPKSVRIVKGKVNKKAKGEFVTDAVEMDRPDREKIAKRLNTILDQPMDGVYQVGSKVYLHHFEKTLWIDQISALFDEEGIRKDERERILAIIDEWYELSEEDWEAKYGRDATTFLDFLRQALKEGK